MMQGAGFVIDHEHNHLGQCWWEMHPAEGAGARTGEQTPVAAADVRQTPAWLAPGSHLDRYLRATDPDSKLGRTDGGEKK